MDIIDCEKQVIYKMSFEEYAEYFESYDRTKIYNVLSLEVSKTKYVLLSQNAVDLSFKAINHSSLQLRNIKFPYANRNTSVDCDIYSHVVFIAYFLFEIDIIQGQKSHLHKNFSLSCLIQPTLNNDVFIFSYRYNYS